MGCEGCGKELGPVDLAGGWSVCMDCTRARHRAAITHRCHCGQKRRPRTCNTGGPRGRCLWTIRQIS